MLALLGFMIVVLDIMALVTIVRSAMSVGGKVLWGVLVVVLPVGGTPLYCAFGQKTSRRPAVAAVRRDNGPNPTTGTISRPVEATGRGSSTRLKAV